MEIWSDIDVWIVELGTENYTLPPTKIETGDLESQQHYYSYNENNLQCCKERT